MKGEQIVEQQGLCFAKREPWQYLLAEFTSVGTRED